MPHPFERSLRQNHSRPPLAVVWLASLIGLLTTGVMANSTPQVPDADAALPALRAALTRGETNAVDLVKAYQARTERLNPTLRAVLTLNPEALDIARALDAQRLAGAVRGPLHGLPVLLKDNIESADPMATTAGSGALSRNLTRRDAPLVAALREAGAVILGKTNLSQWANFRSEHSVSGWSSLGGQVRNPHLLDRNPCGSSSGSGVATAVALAAASIGTETNGSIICPAAVNGIVGFKPTVGHISAAQIVPIAPTQDTAGPMTRTVTGAALLYAVMSGRSPDSVLGALNENALQGQRIGVLRYASGAHPGVLAKFGEALDALEHNGAELIDIEIALPLPERFWQDSFLVLKYEFRRSLNDYLRTSPASIPVRSLRELIAWNDTHAQRELALFDQSIFVASETTAELPPETYNQALALIRTATREDGIDALLARHDVVALTFPSNPPAPPLDAINGDIWPERIGAGWMAAIAGYPHITIPMGTVRALPVGLSLISAADRDVELLGLAYAAEHAAGERATPGMLSDQTQIPLVGRAWRGQ